MFLIAVFDMLQYICDDAIFADVVPELIFEVQVIWINLMIVSIEVQQKHKML